MSTVASLTATANASNSVANAVNPLGTLTSAIGTGSGSATAATGSSNGTQTGTGSTASASTTLGSNFNTFLTLLTTQLQNQDPLSPLDTNQFTQQLVEFSEVEQQINTNSDLQSLLTLQGQADLVSAQSLVGKTAELNDAKGQLTNGTAQFSYTLPSAAASTTVAITNTQGSVLWSGKGETGAGTHNFTWNGEDMNGDTQPDGTYTLQVQATGANGSSLTPTIDSYGVVNSVISNNGTTSLSIGVGTYPISELIGMQATQS